MFNYSGVNNTSNRPPKWKIFNMPSKKSVRYSIVLKQKRDFQQSIEKFMIEVPNWNKMSSCCIVDNSVNTQNINVIFLDGYEFCSCLSLRLFCQEQFFAKTSNSLLVFLNKLNKGGMYTWHNTFIYIKCTASQKWALFYNLFEFLIKNLGNSVIGTQFYVHFICKNLIIKESYFLKHIKENQNSEIFTPPLSEFQTIKNEKHETARIVSKRQFGMKVCSENNSKEDYKVSTKRRKSIDAECVDKSYFKSSCNISKTCNRSNEIEWRHLKPLVKYAIYTDILEAKGILNKLEITRTCSEDSIIYSNVVPKCSSVGKNRINLIADCSVKTTPRLSNPTKAVPLRGKPYKTESEETAAIDINVSRTESNNACNKLFDKENIILQNDGIKSLKHDLGNNQSLNNEHFSDRVNHKQCAVTQKYTHSPEMFSEKTKYHQNCNSFMTFQTAGGKPLKVTKESLQFAQKMYTEVCSQVIDTNKTEPNGSFANLQEGNLKDKHKLFVSGTSRSTSNLEHFDEKEVDHKLNSQPGQSSYIPSNVSFKAHSAKGRKSLGQRRSKPYIKK